MMSRNSGRQAALCPQRSSIGGCDRNRRAGEPTLERPDPASADCNTPQPPLPKRRTAFDIAVIIRPGTAGIAAGLPRPRRRALAY